MAILTVEKLASLELAINPTVAAAGGGDSFPNAGNTYAVVKNGGGAPITVTADVPATDNFGVSGAALDKAFSIAAGATKILGPFRTDMFNDANGRVQLTYSGVTSLAIQVIQL